MVIITEASYPWSSLLQAEEAMKKVTASPSFMVPFRLLWVKVIYPQ
jgi:hypothetical protein